MLGILSLITGFLSPFIPDIIKFWQTKQDHAHELAMRDKDIEAARISGQFAFDSALATANAADLISAREAAPPSYGTQLLDALDDETGWFARAVKLWLIWALSLVEIANGFVRPFMAYYVFALYGAVKASQGYLYSLSVSGPEGITLEIIAQALTTIWGDHDWIIMEYVCGFFLGRYTKPKSASYAEYRT